MISEIEDALSRNKQFLVDERFLVHKKLGQGSYGCVYLACDTCKFNRPVALKIQDSLARRRQANYLEMEADIYKCVGHHTGFAQFVYFERFPEGSVLALQCLGPNLEQLFKECNKQVSLATAFSVGFQLLQALETFHSFGVVHRDIKLANVVSGTGKSSENVFLVDFGSAGRFLDMKEQHVQMKSDQPLVGTAQFASLNAHNGLSLSRRDDIESLAYNLILLATGTLPWMKLKGRKKVRFQRIKSAKETFDTSSIPSELAELLAHARSLGFDQRPDYGRFRKRFHDSMRALVHQTAGVPIKGFESSWHKLVETDSNVQIMNSLLEKSRELKRAEEKATMEGAIKSMFGHITEHCDVPFAIEEDSQRKLFERLELSVQSRKRKEVS